MQRRDKIILGKILQEIEVLITSTKLLTYNSFIANDDKKRAAAMTMINIGELVHNMTPEFKKSARHIPFNEIKATRNTAAHRYHALDFDVIWNTIQYDIPTLKTQIQKILHDSEKTP